MAMEAGDEIAGTAESDTICYLGSSYRTFLQQFQCPVQPDLVYKLADRFFEDCFDSFPDQVMAQPGLLYQFIYPEIFISKICLNNFCEPSDKFLITCIGKVHLLIYKRSRLIQIYKILSLNERERGIMLDEFLIVLLKKTTINEVCFSINQLNISHACLNGNPDFVQEYRQLVKKMN
jgi:hypothetical protein